MLQETTFSSKSKPIKYPLLIKYILVILSLPKPFTTEINSSGISLSDYHLILFEAGIL